MENFALVSFIEELKPLISGTAIRRVVQHHVHGFLLETRSPGLGALKLSLFPRHPAIYISENRPPVESVTSDFSMILRKHLVSARLLDIDKPLSDRIVEMRFKTTLPTRELETVYLIAELLPNSPNLLLLDRARQILGWMRAPHARRQIAKYDEYRYPTRGRVGLELARGEDTSWFDEEGFASDPQNWLIRNVSGVGPVFAAEVIYRKATSSIPVPEQIRAMVERILNPRSGAWIYSRTPMSVILERNDLDALRAAIPSPLELGSLHRTHSVQTFPSILEATRFLSDELESRTLLAEAKSPRIRRIRGRIRRLQQQQQRLQERQHQYGKAEQIQGDARMLVASGAEMDRHHESVEVTDYSAGGPRSLTIEVDRSKTLRENIDGMFKQHRKATRGTTFVRNQLDSLRAEETRLETEISRVESISHWEAWAAQGGPVTGSKAATRTTPRPIPKRRRSVHADGYEILVGRNSRENDELTFKVASENDFWFHVAGYTGSHVIVRNPEKGDELEKSVLLRAAQLAAYYSQARNSNTVDVHYTRCKFISKPKKAKPGLVHLREFKTVKVEPRDWTASDPPSDV